MNRQGQGGQKVGQGRGQARAGEEAGAEGGQKVGQGRGQARAGEVAGAGGAEDGAGAGIQLREAHLA